MEIPAPIASDLDKQFYCKALEQRKELLLEKAAKELKIEDRITNQRQKIIENRNKEKLQQQTLKNPSNSIQKTNSIFSKQKPKKLPLSKSRGGRTR